MIYYIIGAVLAVVLFIIYRLELHKCVKDTFINAEAVPYSVNIPIKDIKIKYTKAYYYEYESQEYERRIRNIFNPSAQDTAFDYSTLKTDLSLLPSEVEEVYNFCTKNIERRVARAPELRLPDGSDIVIQMVEKRILGWLRKQRTIYIRFDCLFYRESKYTGKRVEFLVACTPGTVVSYNIRYLDVAVTEEVAEDLIGMHPVSPSADPFDPLYEEISI